MMRVTVIGVSYQNPANYDSNQPEEGIYFSHPFSLGLARSSLQLTVGIELLKQISKSHVLIVLRRLAKRIWSQMELSWRNPLWVFSQ